MNKKQQLVLQILKPKAKSLGFNAAELQSVAKRIADNLTSDDEADEETIKQEIETAVDLALPYLEMAQKNANRIIEEQRKRKNQQTSKQAKKDEDDQDEDQDDDTPAYVKRLMGEITSLKSEVVSMRADKLSTSRKKQIEELVKEAGSFGKRILRDFEGRSFENDEAFEEFLEGVKTDCEAYCQEMADAGLASMVNAGSKKHNEGNKKDLSDAEVDDLASTF